MAVPRYASVCASFDKKADLLEGKLQVLIDSEYSFEDTLKGFERSMTGRATGKIVIKIDPNIESYKSKP